MFTIEGNRKIALEVLQKFHDNFTRLGQYVSELSEGDKQDLYLSLVTAIQCLEYRDRHPERNDLQITNAAIKAEREKTNG